MENFFSHFNRNTSCMVRMDNLSAASKLRLYRTQGGKYICEQVGRTQWQGEHDRHSGAVCETEAEVQEFFGHGWLAKELYDRAGIQAVEVIE